MGQDSNKTGAGPRRTPKRDGAGDGDRDMGSALRSVYEKTVQEQIPDDLLDLLGKLQ